MNTAVVETEEEDNTSNVAQGASCRFRLERGRWGGR